MDLETFIGLDFYGKIANKADSGGKFSCPLGIWGCVNRNYSEWQVFGKKKIQNN